MARLRIVTLGITALLATACGGGGGASSAPTTGSGSAGATATPPSAAPTADACVADALATFEAGKLTIGTSNPAYPPYYLPRDGGNTDPWDPAQGDPTTGKGFESAMAFAIATQMGFTKDDVVWVEADFNASYAPGPKDYDFFIGQVGFNEERAASASLSEGYYFGNQTVVTMADSDFADATTITELKGAELGAQIGTTSLAAIEEVIATTAEPGVYTTTDDALEAMKNGQIDGVVVDLPTADYITNVQVDGSKIVGQIGAAAGATPEQFSVVLEKDNPLTTCVNQAITALSDDGTLDVLANEWLPFDNVPELQP